MHILFKLDENVCILCKLDEIVHILCKLGENTHIFLHFHGKCVHFHKKTYFLKIGLSPSKGLFYERPNRTLQTEQPSEQ